MQQKERLFPLPFALHEPVCTVNGWLVNEVTLFNQHFPLVVLLGSFQTADHGCVLSPCYNAAGGVDAWMLVKINLGF